MKQVLVATEHVVAQVVPLLASDKAKQLVGLHGFRLHVSHGGIQEAARFAASPRQHVQNGLLVQSCQAGNGTDANALTEHICHLASLFEIHTQIVQWLLF
jgi:hypothetical protein